MEPNENTVRITATVPRILRDRVAEVAQASGIILSALYTRIFVPAMIDYLRFPALKEKEHGDD